MLDGAADKTIHVGLLRSGSEKFDGNSRLAYDIGVPWKEAWPVGTGAELMDIYCFQS
jgi:hypothetical protein